MPPSLPSPPDQAVGSGASDVLQELTDELAQHDATPVLVAAWMALEDNPSVEDCATELTALAEWLELRRVQASIFPVLKAAMAPRMYPSVYPRLQDAIDGINNGKHKSSTMTYYAKLNSLISHVGGLSAQPHANGAPSAALQSGLAALRGAVASEHAWQARVAKLQADVQRAAEQ